MGMSDLGKDLFLQRLKEYEKAIRWALLLVGLGAVFHITVFSKALDLQKKKSNRADVTGKLETVRNETSGVDDLANSLRGALAEQSSLVEKVADDWFRDLTTRFGALNHILRTPPSNRRPPDDASTAGDCTDVSDERYASDLGDDAVKELLLRKLHKEGMLESDGTMPKGDGWNHAMREFTERCVNAPSFERMRAKWRERQNVTARAEKLTSKLEAIRKSLEAIQGEDHVDADIREKVGTTVADVNAWIDKIRRAREAFENVEFKPPEDGSWWETTGRKGDLRAKLKDEAKQQLRSVKLNERISDVRAALDEITADQKKATASVQKELDTMAKEVEKSLTEIPGIDESWFPAGFEMRTFVKSFPGLLGLLLAVVVAWPTYRQRDLARSTVILLESAESDADEQRIHAEYGLPSAPVSPWLVAAVALGVAWIGFSAYRVTDSAFDAFVVPVAAGAVGIVALIGTLGYRIAILRRAGETGLDTPDDA